MGGGPITMKILFSHYKILKQLKKNRTKQIHFNKNIFIKFDHACTSRNEINKKKGRKLAV